VIPQENAVERPGRRNEPLAILSEYDLVDQSIDRLVCDINDVARPGVTAACEPQ
jgi:hypothetical protein